ncbi:MAG: hypothetical protein ACTHXA_05895 [Gulosibacter sp.]|uniref:hypothetical protein n=1 Tax=Gulosibacter sp. TaxID=2817531 RepID=UPI003F90CA40
MGIELAFGLYEVGQHTATLADSSGDGEGILYLLLLGPASGFLFYGAMMRRYRNHDKRYEYEHRSDSEVFNLQSYDNKVDRIVGTRQSRIRGDNSKKPRERLGPNTKVFRRQ